MTYQQLRKAPKALEPQHSLVTNASRGVQFLPPGQELNNVITSSNHALKDAYPVRFHAYADALSHAKAGKTTIPNSVRDVEMLNRLHDYIERERKGHSPTLRVPQLKVIIDIVRHWEAGYRRGYVKCPTGFGKTVLFAELIEAAGVTSAVLVPKKLIAAQTEDKLQRFATDVEVAHLHGGAKKGGSSECLISSYQYVQRKVTPDGKSACREITDRKLIVPDEIHKGIGPKSRNILKAIPADSFVIGFTATPKYDEEHSVVMWRSELCEVFSQHTKYVQQIALLTL